MARKREVVPPTLEHPLYLFYFVHPPHHSGHWVVLLCVWFRHTWRTDTPKNWWPPFLTKRVLYEILQDHKSRFTFQNI